ncbi:MAG: sulfur oxidation c-type cytochrome SoxA [Gammaproteobacteria bacterium]|nr:sulfur oxidation c-type cytochrome SoxA [Gammaproteobacteria bacterium]
MKRLFIGLTALVMTTGLVLGSVANADPKRDLEEYQNYFKKRFPGLSLDDYADGHYSLPAAAAARTEWEEHMAFPPYEIDLVKGKKFWDENGLASCFKNGGKNIAQGYPYWDAKRKEIRTIEEDINECLTKSGKKPIKDLKKGLMAAVVAHFRSMSNGQRMAVQVPKEAEAEYEYGKHFFWAKRGQLNFSCASCHVLKSGQHAGGNVLSAGLGHTTGFPVYRLKWGGLGTVHRRYGGCNKQVRAKPFKAQSREYTALEFYEAYMNTGVPIKAPSMRE